MSLFFKKVHGVFVFKVQKQIIKIQFNNDSYELAKVSAEEIAKHKKRIVEEAINQLLD